MSVYDIVVVGGSFAGLSTAHYLLRHTIPKLEASNSGQIFKLTLVSTTERFLFKVGTPRTIAAPDLIPAEKVLLPIADAFKIYAADHFKLVIGTATGVDNEKRTVSVKNGSGSTAIPYATLVIATGSRTSSPLWTLQDDYRETDAELKKYTLRCRRPAPSSSPAEVQQVSKQQVHSPPIIPTIQANHLASLGEIAYAYPLDQFIKASFSRGPQLGVVSG